MIESRGSRLAIGAASAVAGLGVAQAEGVIGFGDAIAANQAVHSPNHVRNAEVSPGLPRYGGTLVLDRGGQLTPKLDVPEVNAETASSTPQPGDPGYKEYVTKELKKLRSCKYTVNLVPNGADRTQISNKKKMTGKFKVYQNGKTSYSFNLLNGASYCGRYAYTRSGNIVFPNVIRKKRSGKVTDKNGINSPNGYKSVIFFGK